MTDSALRKKPPVFVPALLTGVLCFLSYTPLIWILENTYRDPQITLNETIRFWDNLQNEFIWYCSGLATVTTFFLLWDAARGMAGKSTRASRFASQLGTAFCLAISLLDIFYAAQEFHWLEWLNDFFSDSNIVRALIVLTTVALAVWGAVSVRWPSWKLFQCGIATAANCAMAVLLFATPAHVVASKRGGFLSALGTLVAAYFSLQLLIILGVCAVWKRSYGPVAAATSDDMHAASARYAQRESFLLIGAGFFLLVLSYVIYPLVLRDRFVVAELGQISFFVFASFGAARGIAGVLMRRVRPFWVMGAYVLLAELALIIAKELVFIQMP